MNARQMRAAIWEQVRRIYSMLLVALSICLAFTGIVLIYLNRADYVTSDEYQGYAHFLLLGFNLAHMLFLCFLLFRFGDDTSLSFSVPRYVLFLPISVPAVVIWRLGCGILSVALLAALSTALYYGVFGPAFEAHLPFWTFIVAYPLIYACIQSFAWTVGRAGVAMTVLSGLVAYVLLNALIFDFEFSPFELEYYSTLGVMLTYGITFGLAVIGLQCDRNGRLAFLEDLRGLVPSLRRNRRSQRLNFASPAAALRWYEFRRQARLLPIGVVGLSSAILLTVLVNAGRQIPRTLDGYPVEVHRAVYGETALMVVYVCTAVATFICGGVFLFQNRRVQFGAEKAILFNCPVPTRELVAARFRAMFRAAMLAVVPIAVAAAFALYFASQTPERTVFRPFIDHLGTGEGVILLAFVLIAFLAAVWSCSWLANFLACFTILGIGALIVEAIPAYREFSDAAKSTIQFRVGAALIIPTAIATFIFAYRLRLLTWQRALFALALTPFVATAILVIEDLSNLGNGNTLDLAPLSSTVPALALLPILPFATVPLAMHWARHR